MNSCFILGTRKHIHTYPYISCLWRKIIGLPATFKGDVFSRSLGGETLILSSWLYPSDLHLISNLFQGTHFFTELLHGKKTHFEKPQNFFGGWFLDDFPFQVFFLGFSDSSDIHFPVVPKKCGSTTLKTPLETAKVLLGPILV